MDYLGHNETISEKATPEIRSRFKWVVTEMLTNAIKHSGVDACRLSIESDADNLVLEKEDAGVPLSLRDPNGSTQISWPLKDALLPADFQIYQNGIESLLLTATSRTNAVFSVKEVGNSDLPPVSDTLSEHFGLLILAKAADKFEYEYDVQRGINKFRCVFNLKTTDNETQV
ncbi:ATP-binding protein [Dyadobacter aurulentus]|uniref:anti-sigma regulatory factor n=1 Tax=Dyadobacter sp. UC 10 TaxID=2605428 RepID=UPI0011F181C4|nr:anti-sigma regulatory factor [Dyadobacter sp. UC 10]KAA0993776.1 anti-sigma regulatory factor [Dyadobacter sp. UC 10]